MSQNRGLDGVRGNGDGKNGQESHRNGVLWRNWGGEAIRVVQGGDEKPLIGKDTPVQLQSISYKGLFLLVRPGGGAADRAGAYQSTPVELPTGR